MLVARCSGSGTGAHLTAQRMKEAWSDRGAGRTSFCPCSYPHRLSASASRPSISYPHRLSARPLRCSTVPSPDMEEWSMEEWSVTKKRRNEEWVILKAEVAHMFQPLVRNLSKIFALRSPYDLEDYQIGMFFGTFLGCVGCYQLWKIAPSTFVDCALALLMYKLSIVSSELHRHNKSNSLTTRMKFGTILVMVLKDIKKNYVLLDAIRMPVFLLYICCFLFDVAGLKKYGRRALISLVTLLRMRGGLKEIWRIMWWPGYVSPYDDVVMLSDVEHA